MSKVTLYKRTSTGDIQSWTCYALKDQVIVEFGKLDGKKQIKSFSVSAKNVGKSNEKNIAAQASIEAQQRVMAQLKSGYVRSIEALLTGEVDEVIEGGLLPMLAETFEDHKHKLKFPVYAQPKLDGHRCIAMFDGEGKVTLWSRTRKPIKSCPHIVAQLELIGLKGVTLDGELYLHRMPFEKLSSLLRKSYATPETSLVDYNIYDIVSSSHYRNRLSDLSQIEFFSGPLNTPNIKFVSGVFVNREADLKFHHDKFVAQGYEGLMVRDLNHPYHNKRTPALLKMKVMQDAEFPILSVRAGADQTVVFTCEIDGKTFDVTMSGSREANQAYLTQPFLWRNRKLTVQYFRLTEAGIPYLPVGLRIRQDI